MRACVCKGRINGVCAYTSIGRQADLTHSGGPVMMLRLDSEKNIYIIFFFLKQIWSISPFLFTPPSLNMLYLPGSATAAAEAFHSLCGREKKKKNSGKPGLFAQQPSSAAAAAAFY